MNKKNTVLKRDPTRTTLLRRKFMVEMKKRFTAVSKDIKKVLVDTDALGVINPKAMLLNVDFQAWRFATDTNKVKSFRDWLEKRVNAGVLEHTGTGKPWLSTYIESAYKKGAVKSYVDTHPDLGNSKQFYLGGKNQFLTSSFAAPEAVSKIEFLYTRAYDQLKDITSQMSQQISMILADGLVAGYSPYRIAKEMSDKISKITRTRALVISRTEIIRAHAEGQLDSLVRLGIKEVGAEVEWSTAGDEVVCPLCADLEGRIYKISEARGLIPLHPNCRCAWLPIVDKTKAGKETKPVIPTVPQKRDIPVDVPKPISPAPEGAPLRPTAPGEWAYSKKKGEWVEKSNWGFESPNIKGELYSFWRTETVESAESVMKKMTKANLSVKDARALLIDKTGPSTKMGVGHTDKDAIPFIKKEYGPELATSSQIKEVDNLLEWIKKVSGDSNLDANPSVIRMKKHYRSYYDSYSNTIALYDYAERKAFIHEFGHAIESSNTRVADKIVKFLSKRIGPTETPIKNSIGELCYKDNFKELYCGRAYNYKSYRTTAGNLEMMHGSTEILSMGLQMLHDNPTKFAQTDPEYFKLVYECIKGIL